MAFNISDFKSNIETYGVIPNNLFEIYITPPSAIFGGKSIKTDSNISRAGINTFSVNDVSREMIFRAEEATLPVLEISTIDSYRYGVGPAQKTPFSVVFNNELINLTFLSDRYGALWQFWYYWYQSIFNFSGIDSGTPGTINASGSYGLDYKENYSTDVTVIIYDRGGNVVQAITYTQAYPAIMNSVKLAWGTEKQLLKINVGLYFTDFTIRNSSLTT